MSAIAENLLDKICGLCGRYNPIEQPVSKMITPTTSRPMNSWICYLKTCAKESNYTLMECAELGKRNKNRYYEKKDYWQQEAIIGCPRGR